MKKLLLVSLAAAVAFCGENLLVGADRGRLCKFRTNNHPSQRGQDGGDRGRRGVFEKNGS